MRNQITVTMLGYRGSGKTSYLLATYHEMHIGADGFALDALDDIDARELDRKWRTLTGDPREWPGGDDIEPTPYRFRLTYRANSAHPLATLTWVDHRGGDASWYDPADPGDRDKLKKWLTNSQCIFLCLSGETIKEFRHQGTRLYEELQIPSLRMFIDEVVKTRRRGQYRPLPIAVIVTMADCFYDDLVDTLKEVMAGLGWLLKPGGPSGDPSFLVGFFPVSLGDDLHIDKNIYPIDPWGIKAPVLFAAWANARQNVTDFENSEALESLKLLGSQLAPYPIVQNGLYLSRAQKLLPAEEVGPRRIFISHSSKDNDFCDQLVRELDRAGAEVWYDQRDMEQLPLLRQLAAQLGACPTMIAVLSQDAFDSRYVQEEWEFAQGRAIKSGFRSRKILPVTAKPYHPDEVEDTFLSEWPCIDQEPGIPLPKDQAIAMVLKRLRLEPAKTPTSSEELEELIASGNALLAQQRDRDAIAKLEGALLLDRKNIEALTSLAFAYLSIGEPIKSLTSSRRALDLSPTDARVWELMGEAYYGLGPEYLRDAISAYRQAVQLAPHNDTGWNNLGIALYDLGRDHEAIDAINHALDIDDAIAYRWSIRGDILTRLGKPDEARESYDRALDLDSRMVNEWPFNVSSPQL